MLYVEAHGQGSNRGDIKVNKTPRLSKSGIEYLGYVWNFYSGCRHKQMGICHVDKCWAEGITKRMKHNYPNGFEPTFYPEAFLSPLHLKKPSIIGCAFMGDLFGDWINYTDKNGTVTPQNIVYPIAKRCPQHTFLFLTKRPQNLIKWSPFPDNCWVGVSVCNDKMLDVAVDKLEDTQAKVKFISFEPLQKRLTLSLDYAFHYSGISWAIIGAQTKPYKPPKMTWIDEIVRACDKAGISVFEKNNLMPLVEQAFGREIYQSLILTPDGDLRQEMPYIH